MFDPDFTECETPAKVNNELKFDNIIETWPEFNWSIYELVTVHVIAEDELPSERDLHNWIESQYEDYVLDAQDIYGWLKSQILKP